MKTIALLALSLACVAAPQAPAQGPRHVQGKVVHVDDGDTLVLLVDGRSKLRVRLSDIDAPESAHGKGRPGQPFSRKSTESLASLAHGRNAEASCFEKDRYGRSVCRVEVDGVDINAEQVRRGMAWANGAAKRYVRDARVYALEAQARGAKVGLWATPVPAVAPWHWRKACWLKGACDGQGE